MEALTPATLSAGPLSTPAKHRAPNYPPLTVQSITHGGTDQLSRGGTCQLCHCHHTITKIQFESLSPAKAITFTTTVATVTFIMLMVLNTVPAEMNLLLEGCSALSLGKSALQGGTADALGCSFYIFQILYCFSV